MSNGTSPLTLSIALATEKQVTKKITYDRSEKLTNFLCSFYLYTMETLSKELNFMNWRKMMMI